MDGGVSGLNPDPELAEGEGSLLPMKFRSLGTCGYWWPNCHQHREYL
jgi:hypothetical protein